GMAQYNEKFNFVWGQATAIESQFAWGGFFKVAFLVMGVAILMTTELGVLDVVARISTDIVKVNYLRDNEFWSLSKLYFCFLWGEILLGVLILFAGFNQPLLLVTTSAAMNGGVMFIYSLILLYMNNKILGRSLSMSPVRFVAIVWSCAFFGYFSFQALKIEVIPYLKALFDTMTGPSM
ncbi:MAG: Nramp family divalent metal transporter, partial [Planctomycetes bacterium]|nr:Nramp family divalent metal transporter [Planctomycetota bacterium]